MKDFELIRECIKNDKKAWETFVSKYSRLIYNYIYSVLKDNNINHSEDKVNDLFQEFIFVLIKDDFKKLKIFQGFNGCSFASWLRVLTVNFVLDYIKKIKKIYSFKDDMAVDLEDSVECQKELVNQKVIYDEQLFHLKDCVSVLDIQDKYFLEFYLDKMLSLDEIKLILGVSRAAVDMRKSRILNRLKQCFKKKGFVFDLSKE